MRGPYDILMFPFVGMYMDKGIMTKNEFFKDNTVIVYGLESVKATNVYNIVLIDACRVVEIHKDNMEPLLLY